MNPLLAHLSPVAHVHAHELGAVILLCAVALVVLACKKQSKKN